MLGDRLHRAANLGKWLVIGLRIALGPRWRAAFLVRGFRNDWQIQRAYTHPWQLSGTGPWGFREWVGTKGGPQKACFWGGGPIRGAPRIFRTRNRRYSSTTVAVAM